MKTCILTSSVNHLRHLRHLSRRHQLYHSIHRPVTPLRLYNHHSRTNLLFHCTLDRNLPSLGIHHYHSQRRAAVNAINAVCAAHLLPLPLPLLPPPLPLITNLPFHRTLDCNVPSLGIYRYRDDAIRNIYLHTMQFTVSISSSSFSNGYLLQVLE